MRIGCAVRVAQTKAQPVLRHLPRPGLGYVSKTRCAGAARGRLRTRACSYGKKCKKQPRSGSTHGGQRSQYARPRKPIYYRLISSSERPSLATPKRRATIAAPTMSADATRYPMKRPLRLVASTIAPKIDGAI